LNSAINVWQGRGGAHQYSAWRRERPQELQVRAFFSEFYLPAAIPRALLIVVIDVFRLVWVV
jgi:hypothetical protein